MGQTQRLGGLLCDTGKSSGTTGGPGVIREQEWNHRRSWCDLGAEAVKAKGKSGWSLELKQWHVSAGSQILTVQEILIWGTQLAMQKFCTSTPRIQTYCKIEESLELHAEW